MTVRYAVFLLISVFCSGCNWFGFLASPTAGEQKIPAEFNLKNHSKRNILVFVDSAHRSGSDPIVEAKLAQTINTYLNRYVRIDDHCLLGPETVRQLNTHQSALARLTPAELGRRAAAEMVLYVHIERFELVATGQNNYHSGQIVTRTTLFDCAGGNIIWPGSENGRLVKAAELETAGRDITIARLLTTTAHCITRNFYDCPKNRFRISGENIDYTGVSHD